MLTHYYSKKNVIHGSLVALETLAILVVDWEKDFSLLTRSTLISFVTINYGYFKFE